jgi:hypothetical protein
MNRRNVSQILLGLILTLSVHAQASLTVHEWGTFTSLIGSNGKAQNGMYYEDEALPEFVHNFGEPNRFGRNDILRNVSMNFQRLPHCPGHPKVPCKYLVNQNITQKMETPVVYFYSDKPQKVNFEVAFPRGIISQSYPAASYSLPFARPGVELKNGYSRYEVSILKNSNLIPPSVDSANIYSHARNVASDLIQVGQEVEKFIFYRGLGEFQTQLDVTSQQGSIDIVNKGVEKVPAAYLIYTDGIGYGDVISLGSISSTAKVEMDSLVIKKLQSTKQPQSQFLNKARGLLLSSLVDAGLFADEAKSMVDTWEHGYFKTPGLRILYVLSGNEVEEILPIRVTPKPDRLNRVFIGRIEILLDTVEQSVLYQILQQGIQYDVSQLGRMAQPILLRIQELALENGILNPELTYTISTLISRIP